MLCDVDVSCICTHGRCHVMLTSLALTHMVGAARCRPNVLSSATRPVVSLEMGPRFPRHGAGNRAPVSGKTLRRKSVPNLGRAWRESSLLPLGCKLGRLPTRPNSPGRPCIFICYMAIASGPSPATPKSWSLCFGFWVSLLFLLFAAAPNGAVWILDFGFLILDFGV